MNKARLTVEHSRYYYHCVQEKLERGGGGGSVHMLHQKILASYKGIIIEATICLIPHICIGK